MVPFNVRQAVLRDVPRLVELNSAAYPDLVEDGVVFDAAQLTAQQSVFPEGQLVVERAGEIVGAIATLMVPRAAAEAQHSWCEITSYGTFAAHDRNGSALYIADIYVSPDARGLGVGAKLYDAAFRLCEKKRLECVAAGGRLWGYHEVAHEMPPSQYVDEVIRGIRKDRVLTSQLRAGFVVRGILSDYLQDWRSANYATHLFWENPLARSAAREPSAAQVREDENVVRAE